MASLLKVLTNPTTTAIKNGYMSKKFNISLEYFPPKTEQGQKNLLQANRELATLEAEYCSVTFGAGGSSRQGTLDTVKLLQSESCKVFPHISCIGSSKAEIATLLDEYKQCGIRALVVLRGDQNEQSTTGELRYANELVDFIRQHSGQYFHIEVAGYPEYHPESPTPQSDIENLKKKVDAGANGIITQYFYNIDAFYHFFDSCQKAGIHVPITPGIMPITNYTSLKRFSDLCGAEIPRWIDKNLQALQHNPAELIRFGNDIVSEMCLNLIDSGIQSLHFYTLNRSQATLDICRLIQDNL